MARAPGKEVPGAFLSPWLIFLALFPVKIVLLSTGPCWESGQREGAGRGSKADSCKTRLHWRRGGAHQAGSPRQRALVPWLPRKVPGKTLVARLSRDGTSSGKPALTPNCIRASLPFMLPHPLGPSVMVLIAHSLTLYCRASLRKSGTPGGRTCQILGSQKGPAELASVSEGMNDWSRPWGWTLQGMWVSAGNTPVFLLFALDI